MTFKKVMLNIGNSLLISMLYFLVIFISYELLYSFINKDLEGETYLYLDTTFIIILNTIISSYFFYKQQLEKIINIIILGILSILGLFTVTLMILSLPDIIHIILFDKVIFIFILKVFIKILGRFSNIIYYPVVVNTLLLWNLIILFYFYIISIIIITKYRKKYKNKIVNYCKIAIYATFFALIFSCLALIYI